MTTTIKELSAKTIFDYFLIYEKYIIDNGLENDIAHISVKDLVYFVEQYLNYGDNKTITEENTLLKIIANIAYIAGSEGYNTENFNTDAENFIRWAKEFNELHENTDWNQINFFSTIFEYMKQKIKN